MGSVRISTISRLNVFRLFYRSVFFIILLTLFINCRLSSGADFMTFYDKKPLILYFIWFVFLLELFLRFFPSRFDSPGCQKHLARNYIKTGSTDIEIQDNHGIMFVALIWIGCNAVFGILFLKGILTEGMMVLLVSFYSCCDIFCILFYCPFQSLFLKNRCCVTCRMYNWDYPMMFTPFIFVWKAYATSLFLLALLLFIVWEYSFFRHPERFSVNTNAYISCRNCTERLCGHKKQLKRLWRHTERYQADKLRWLQ